MIAQVWICEVSKILAAKYAIRVEDDRIIVTAPSGAIYYIDYINKNRFNVSTSIRDDPIGFSISGPKKDANFIMSLIESPTEENEGS
jgi:hypothetical protein